MTLIVFGPRKKAYRKLVAPIGYHLARDTRHSSLAIGPIMNLELKDVQAEIREKKGVSS